MKLILLVKHSKLQKQNAPTNGTSRRRWATLTMNRAELVGSVYVLHHEGSVHVRHHEGSRHHEVHLQPRNRPEVTVASRRGSTMDSQPKALADGPMTTRASIANCGTILVDASRDALRTKFMVAMWKSRLENLVAEKTTTVSHIRIEM